MGVAKMTPPNRALREPGVGVAVTIVAFHAPGRWVVRCCQPPLMNEDIKRIKRRVQVRFHSILFLLVGVGAVLVWSLRSLLHIRPPPIVTALLLLLPNALFLLWPRRAAPSDLRLVPLRSFLATPDAGFAPNQPEEVSLRIADWLSAFADRHGPEAVLIAVQPDEPHLTDAVFLIGTLSADDDATAGKLGVDSISRISRANFARRFPSAAVQKHPIHEVLWD